MVYAMDNIKEYDVFAEYFQQFNLQFCHDTEKETVLWKVSVSILYAWRLSQSDQQRLHHRHDHAC